MDRRGGEGSEMRQMFGLTAGGGQKGSIQKEAKGITCPRNTQHPVSTRAGMREKQNSTGPGCNATALAPA